MDRYKYGSVEVALRCGDLLEYSYLVAFIRHFLAVGTDIDRASPSIDDDYAFSILSLVSVAISTKERVVTRLERPWRKTIIDREM